MSGKSYYHRRVDKIYKEKEKSGTYDPNFSVSAQAKIECINDLDKRLSAIEKQLKNTDSVAQKG